jgi:hypothetical protein
MERRHDVVPVSRAKLRQAHWAITDSQATILGWCTPIIGMGVRYRGHGFETGIIEGRPPPRRAGVSRTRNRAQDEGQQMKLAYALAIIPLAGIVLKTMYC